MTQLDDNKELVAKAIGLLSGDTPVEFAEVAFSPSYTDHGAPDEHGPERFLKVRQQLQTAFPDLTHEIESIVAEGDLVVVRLVLRGTHDGPFRMGRPIEPTHKKVEIRSMHMLRIEGGQAVEHWVFRDDLGLMRQLGVIPGGPGGPPGAGVAGPPPGVGAPAGRAS